MRALSATLRVSLPALEHTCANLDRHYTAYAIPKADGSQRSIVIPSLHLKTIQKRINREIFSHVTYPEYLYGGVPGKDYVRNAKRHELAHVVIALDVKNFYPSISKLRVSNIYQHLFKFGADVSDFLAALTTYENKVPQGACTSSHLANLVLHDVESSVVKYCNDSGLVYTRLLDDITISSTRRLPEKKVEKIVGMVATMLKGKGLKLKHNKTRVSTKANPEELMEVTGLWLNRGAPRVHSVSRRLVRVEVYKCKEAAKVERVSESYHKAFARASGRVAMLCYLGHAESGRLRKSLSEMLPLYDVREVTKTKKIVKMLGRTSEKDRSKYSYNVSYFKTMQRINIVSRTDPLLARTLRHQLLMCKPKNKSDAALYDEPI
ncbi:reverse transcriptase family protein [Caballeronia sp. BCC1704]|uniref:reverse transcriptase family protein n=1 Tax=Caballeronia sp. BCC1704 TaxID=2676300 RepID=UPI0024464899|nr:reverse transcriptase family protein [Caballeronia sp. BCC1704]